MGRAATMGAIAAGGVALCLAACGEERADTAAIELWALGREGEVVRELVPEFERRHPGLRVRVQQIPWSAAHEKLLTAYAGDALPDVFQLGNTWISEFVALRALAPLDEWIARSASLAPDDYFPGILATNALDGATWGVPWYVDTRLLFYRADLFARAGQPSPPRTWSEWLEALSRVKELAGPEHYAILLPTTEWQPPVILGLQLGSELLRDRQTRGNFASPPFRAAFAWYVELFRRGLAPRIGAAQVGNLYRDFASGHVAMLVTGPWNLGEFRERLPADLQSSWATAPMPAPDAAGPDAGPGLSLAGGASLVLARRSPRASEAWRLVEYLSEPAVQARFYERSGDLPARRSAWRAAGLADDPHANAFWRQLERLAQLPPVPEWERIATQLTRAVEAAVRDERTIDEALAELDRDVDAILAKRRWMMQRRSRRATPEGDVAGGPP